MSFEVGRLSAALTLDGVDQFNRGLDTVGSGLDATGRRATTATAATSSFFKNIQKAARETPQQLSLMGSAFTKVGLVAAAAAGLAISKWANFDQAMSNVRAATHESASNMELLKQAALDAGADTVFSATEAANAIEEMSKAGVETTDILNGGLRGALDLASAGQLGVAQAAGIAATALSQFGLKGSDMSHVADLLAAGAGKAQGEVTDLSTALSYVGPVAAGMGISIEETTGTLAAFADKGIIADQAGSGLRGMLSALTSPSKQAGAELERLGVQLYDANGKFLGLANLAGQLSKAYKGASDQEKNFSLGLIFGNEQITAARVAMEAGEDGIRKWTDAVNDQNYAADTAKDRLNNLKGDIEALGGALDTALITSAQQSDGVLRDMVQTVTKLVDGYNQLPAPLKSSTVVVALLTAGVALLGGAFVKGTIAAAEFKVALSTLGVTKASVTSAARNLAGFLMGPWGIAIAAATLAVHQFNQAVEQQKTSSDVLQKSLESNADAYALMTKNASDSASWIVDVSKPLEDLPGLLDKTATGVTSSWDAITQWGNGITFTFADEAAVGQVKELGQAFADLSKTDMPNAVEQFTALTTSQKLNGAQSEELLNQMPAFRNELIKMATEAGLSTDNSVLLQIALGRLGPASDEATSKTQEHTAALAELQGKSGETGDSIDALAETIRGFGSATLDSRQANRELKAAYDELRESVEKNGSTLNTNTEQGRANEEALDNIAEKAKNAAAATAERTGNEEKAAAVMQKGRDGLINMLGQFGITGKAAEKYADKLGLIPENVKTAVDLNTDPATAELNAWIAYNSQRTVRIAVGLGGQGGQVSGSANGNLFSQGVAQAFANGGFPTGFFPGGRPIYKFAEPETGWEAFISGRKGQEKRNAKIAMESLARLGFPVIPVSALRGVPEFANGGSTARAPLPSLPPQSVRVDRKRRGDGPLVGNVYLGERATRNDLRELEETLDRIRREG